MEEKPKLFVRKTSGLIREFGLLSTFAFDVISYSVGICVLVSPLFVGGLFPGASFIQMIFLGAILTVFNVGTYGWLAGTMPRSGGEYVYNGRVLHPAIGFMSNWGFAWSQFLGIAIYASWAVNYVVATTLATAGYVLDTPWAVALSETVASPTATWALGTLIVWTIALLQLAPVRWLKQFLNVGYLIATIGSVVIIVVFAMHSRESFVPIFNDFVLKAKGIPDAYNYVLSTALAQGFTIPEPSAYMTLLSIPMGYWIFIGLTYSTYIGAEVKEPSKVQPLAIFFSLVFGVIFYVFTFGLYYEVVGSQFNDALGFLNLANPEAIPLPVPPVVSTFSGLLAGNVVTIAVMSVSYFLWIYLLLICMTTICVRMIFSWSFDRIMPAKLTTVTRYGTPWVAAIITAIASSILMTLWMFTPYFQYVTNYIVIFSIAFWITSWAAILLPFRKKELFELAPPMAKKKIAGVPLMVIAGIGNMVLFSLILYSSFMLPAFSGPVGVGAISFVVGIYLSGIIIFYIARAIRRSRGIDLDMIYTELPPE